MKQSRTVSRRNDRPVLSICMIVKNEEKNLERCLRSLRPLLLEINSELIVTDTGSTDHTVEIARKYTDQIIHFAWRDDFAAARNSGLEAAKGEWVMAIDADEELCDDLSEVIRFFNSGLRYQFARASGVMKNVLDIRDRDAITNEQNVNHFYRMDTRPRYEGRIHETVKMESPHYQFGFIGYHYGYAYENDEEKIRKMERNMSLIRKELEERPENLRLLLSALDSVQEPKERMELIERVTKATRVSESPVWMTSGYKHLLEEYMDLQQWDKLLEIGREFENSRVYGSPKMEIVLLDFHYAMATAAFCLQRNEEGILYSDKYLKLYGEYQAGWVDRTILMFISINSFYDLRYNKILLLKTEMLYRLGQMKEAANSLSSIREERMDVKQLAETFMLAIILMQQEGVELPAGRFYAALKQMGRRGGSWEREARRIYLDLEAKMACCTKKNRVKMAALFLKPEQCEPDDFLKIMELISFNNREGVEQNKEENKESALERRELIGRCIEDVQNWDYAFPELYYIAFQAEAPLPCKAFHVAVSRLGVISDHILTAHSQDLGEWKRLAVQLPKVCGEDEYQLTLLGDLFEKALKMLEKGLLGEAEDEKEKQIIKTELLKAYSAVMGLLLGRIYRPELLLEENVELLPLFHQRGYWLSHAYTAMEAKDYDKCEACIKGLVRSDKDMRETARWFADEYEERRRKEQQKKDREEFEQLAKNVKLTIRKLIEEEQTNQAKLLLVKLKRMCPEDTEIGEMIQQLHK